MKRAAIAIALAGCTSAHVNRATLIASTVALACDWGQTRSAASAGWQYRDRDGDVWRINDGNPLVGYRPSPGQVDAYFAASALLNVALWAVMPRRYKAVVPVAVSATEIYAIGASLESTRDASTGGTGVCGF